jgi:hypothetical protein
MGGAGVLPFCYHNGQLHFLFGKEQEIDENQGWSDFGGGANKGESKFATAAREGTEETSGFLGDVASMRRRMHKSHHVDWKQYRTYLIPLEYDAKLPFYYNNNQRLLRGRLDAKFMHDTTIFEKARIEWIPLDKVRDMLRLRKFRDFYNNVVQKILASWMLYRLLGVLKAPTKTLRIPRRGRGHTRKRR